MSASDEQPISRQEPSSAAQPRPPDVWADGAAYEAYVGRWSRLVAREFLSWLAIAPRGRWLEVGCGTGVLAQPILQNAQPASLIAIDRSPDYVTFARQQVSDARARFDVGDVHALLADTATCDCVVSGLVLNFLAHPDLALREMARVARDGATVATYVWDYAGRM